jgi:putative tryptophan/tyrosine transport system substrate-binding protein
MAARSAQRRNPMTDAVSDVAYWHGPDPTATSARISGSSSEARFRPYESTRLRRTLLPVERGANMRRREFLGMLGSSAAAWPVVARAQQLAVMPVIGFLSARSAKDSASAVDAFGRGLRLAGCTEGKNLSLEYGWAEGKLDRLPELAADLVRRPVTVLVAVGGANSALAAKSATSTIPIVFVMGADPVKLGLAASFSHPGGNATGVTILIADLAPKRLGLLRELLPKATAFAALTNPITPEGETQSSDALAAAHALGLKLRVLKAGDETSIAEAFDTLAQEKVEALLVGSDQYFDVHRDKVVALAATAGIPAIYQFRDYPVAGGLISYGPDVADAYHHAGNYVGQILNGKQPADLPVLQPTKFELVINLKSAKGLGIEIPPTLLARADEVIE